MPANSASAASREQLLGEIETRVVGMQHYDVAVGPGEQINLERQPENPHDARAICVENGRFEAIGHLPRRLSSWLAPLIDAGKLRVEGYVPKTGRVSRNACPVVLIVFLCEAGRHILEKPDIRVTLDGLHEVVRRVHEDAQGYTDPDLILGLADGLRPLCRQELLPESHLLLALLPGIAREVRTALAFQAMANMWEPVTGTKGRDFPVCQTGLIPSDGQRRAPEGPK